MLCKSKKDALRIVKEKNVSFIQIWFTDILGVLKSFAITPSELEAALEEGMGFDGSSIEGFARIEESDMIAFPDPTTLQFLPWRPTDRPVARMFCDILQPEGSHYEGDPRYVFKRVLQQRGESEALQAVAVMQQGMVVDQILGGFANTFLIEERRDFADRNRLRPNALDDEAGTVELGSELLREVSFSLRHVEHNRH